MNLEFHLGGNLIVQICWRKTFPFFHVGPHYQVKKNMDNSRRKGRKSFQTQLRCFLPSPSCLLFAIKSTACTEIRNHVREANTQKKSVKEKEREAFRIQSKNENLGLNKLNRIYQNLEMKIEN